MTVATAVLVAVMLAAIVVALAYLLRRRSRGRESARALSADAAPETPKPREGRARETAVEDPPDHVAANPDTTAVRPGAPRVAGAADQPTEQLVGRTEGPFESETQEQLGRYTFDSFIVGAGNRSAYRVAKAAAERPGLRFNPLFIYGGPGLGKTHLMCALANEVYRRNSDANVRYMTSQAFAERILDAYSSREVGEFEREYVETDVLLIDDIQFLAVSESLQSVVARILGEMYEQGKQIAVSSDRRPEDLRGLAQETTATFATGVIVEVDRPDAALRTRILRRKARLGDWPLEDELIVHVARCLNGDIRTLEGVAMKLVALKTLQGIRLDTAVADDLLKRVAAYGEQTPPPPESGRAPDAGFGASYGSTPEKVSAAGEEPVPEREGAAPRHVNPLVREFSRAIPVVRKLADLNEVASAVPEAAAAFVIVLGTSHQLVVSTVEAMVGRETHRRQSLEVGPWAYMVHLQCNDPDWVLLGSTSWDEETELAQALASHRPAAFVVVLDGAHPEIANAKELIASVPGDGGMAVVVLGNFLSDSTDALRKMLRRLLGVPEEFPVLVQGAVDTPGSRTWVKRALESRPRGS